jgi:hypothetical protein
MTRKSRVKKSVMRNINKLAIAPPKNTPEKILAQQQRAARIKEKNMELVQLGQKKDTRTTGRTPTRGRVGRRTPTRGRVGRRTPTRGRGRRQRTRRKSTLIRVNNKNYQSYMEEKKKIFADADNKIAILSKQTADLLHKLGDKFPEARDQELQELRLKVIKYNQEKLKNNYKKAMNANSYDSTKVSETLIGNRVVVTPTDNNYNQYMEEKKKINADENNKKAILSKQMLKLLDELENKFPGAGDRERKERHIAGIKDKKHYEQAKYYENYDNFNTGDRSVTKVPLNEQVKSPLSPLNSEDEFDNQYNSVSTETTETMPTMSTESTKNTVDRQTFNGNIHDTSTVSTKIDTVDMPTIYGTNPDMSTVSTKIDTLR